MTEEQDWLPTHWTMARLDDLATFRKESVDPEKSPNEEFNYLSIGNIESETGKLVDFRPTQGKNIGSLKLAFTKDDILYSRLRPYLNKVFMPDFDGISATDLLPIRPKEGVEKKYLGYYLRTRRVVEYANQRLRGIQLPRLPTRDLLALPVPIAPSKEQKRIVAKVEALFAQSGTVREALEKIPVLLKSFRQSVLAKAFIGQLTNRVADDIQAPELVRRIESQRPKSESSLRAGRRRTTLKTRDSTNLAGLPKGWDWVRFKDIAFAQNGRSFPSKFYTEEGVRLLRPGNLHASGRLLWTTENTRYLPRSFSDRYSEFLIRENEIVMNLTAQSLKDEFLGRVCMTDQETYCLLNQRQARIRANEAIDGRYLFWVLKSPIFRDFVTGLESGTLIQHMFTWQLNDFSLPLAPLKEQKKVVQRIEECLSYADGVERATEAVLNRVNGIDQSILSKAFRGELVPQNPNDEPALVLLERIRAASHLDKSLQERY
jgi:type I restriction enzyme S subunit